MAGVFLSYRRSDSPGTTGRLYDFLRQRLYPVPVFRDIYSLMPGVKYEEAIRQALSSSGVLLVVIGPRWLNASDANGRRLDDPTDLLRGEIATALAWNIPVIPVLVDGATMPAAGHLPRDLQQLSGLQSIKLSDEHWDHDAERLLGAVAARLGHRIGPTEQTTTPSVTRRRGVAASIAVLVLFTLVLAVGAVIFFRAILPIFEGFFDELTSEPTIALSKSSGPPGTSLTVEGSGFRGGEEVVISFHTVEVGRIRADDDGAFEKTVQVPSNWQFRNEQFHFRAEGNSSIRSARMPFQVT